MCVPLPESKVKNTTDEPKEKTTGAGSGDSKGEKSGDVNKGTKAEASNGNGASANAKVGDSTNNTKSEGATGGEKKQRDDDDDDIATMMIVPGRYEDFKDRKEPSVEDIRAKVERKVAKFGLTVDSVKKVDCRNNPELQDLLQKIL